uniref:Transcription factor S-II n=1 Tax=Pithovirus LCPAC101 TaxID=2506586 RepID=A0A481Z3C7_9VIRU|nr:MAG: transcription factor S-II [Pithovirus LCPAC101]
MNSSVNNTILDKYMKNIGIFTDSQYKLLMDLKYSDGKQFLIYHSNNAYYMYNTGVLYDYINLYVVHDFDVLYEQSLNILGNPEVTSIKDVIFSLDIFRQSEMKLQNKINANRVQTVVEEGIYVCPKCSSKKTITTSGQTRSLDEASTIFVTCVPCKFNWSFAG